MSFPLLTDLVKFLKCPVLEKRRLVSFLRINMSTLFEF